MITSNLTTLANIKGWLGITGSTDDAMLTRLVQSNSSYIQSWLSRAFILQTYRERRNGGGRGDGLWRITFANRPVQSVSYVAINGIEVAASVDGGVLQTGYGFDETQIWLARTTQSRGVAGFTSGVRNVELTYTAGFVTGGRWLDVQQIPTTPFQITPAFMWLLDVGVQDDAGLPFTKVASSPAVGQYAVSSAGVYTFNTADASKFVTLLYSHIPPDVEQACVDMIALQYRGKDRIGQVSKAIGTETVSFTKADLTPNVKTLLSQYKNILPL